MADVKWIKITTDMFDNRKIKHLRRLPEGNNIVLIWVMLLTMAGRCNAGGMIFLTENIPYTTKMLADELDFEENTVMLALNALEQLGMIAVLDNGFFSIEGWAEHQNVDRLSEIREYNRIAKQKSREKQKLIKDVNDMSMTSQRCQETDKDIDKDIDKEIDINIDVNKNINNVHSKAEINAFFESIWNIYPVKKGKGQVSDAKRKKLFEIGFDEMQRAITRYLDELQKDSDWRKPQNGSTFFNSGYVDYLDANFEPQDRSEVKGNAAQTGSDTQSPWGKLGTWL